MSEYAKVKRVKKLTRKNFRDLEGKRFGRWLVVAYAGSVNSVSHWYCKCDCGLTKRLQATSLIHGRSKSCGCLLKSIVTTHGMSGTPEYEAYQGCISRCTRKSNSSFGDYGGRGIEFRFNSFEEFYAEVGKRPSPNHSLDRIDVNGHYEKGNIRWATLKEQCSNRRSNIYLGFNGKTLTVSQWGKMLGLPEASIRSRKKQGWCDSCTLTGDFEKECCRKAFRK